MNDAAKSLNCLTVQKKKKNVSLVRRTVGAFRKHLHLWPTKKRVRRSVFVVLLDSNLLHWRYAFFFSCIIMQVEDNIKKNDTGNPRLRWNIQASTQRTFKANSPFASVRTCLKQFRWIYSVPQILQHAARGDTSDCWRCDFRRFSKWNVWEQDSGSEHVSRTQSPGSETIKYIDWNEGDGQKIWVAPCWPAAVPLIKLWD